MASAIRASLVRVACYPLSSTTVGAHRWRIRAGEEQLLSQWGAATGKLKEIRLPRHVLAPPPPLSLMPAQPKRGRRRVQEAVGFAGKMGRAETRGRSSPTLLHLSFLHARSLEEQVEREAAMASGGATQGRPRLQVSDLMWEVWYNA